MEKQGFSIFYNGRHVAVTAMEDNTFAVQITYKPLYITLTTASDGKKNWIDREMHIETSLSKEIGQLIASHPSFTE